MCCKTYILVFSYPQIEQTKIILINLLQFTAWVLFSRSLYSCRRIGTKTWQRDCSKLSKINFITPLITRMNTDNWKQQRRQQKSTTFRSNQHPRAARCKTNSLERGRKLIASQVVGISCLCCWIKKIVVWILLAVWREGYKMLIIVKKHLF